MTSKKYSKRCARCEAIFYPDKLHPYQKYCGYSCRTKAKYEKKKGEPLILNCVICDSKFQVRGPKLTCSDKCSEIRKNKKRREWDAKNWEQYHEYVKEFRKKHWKAYKEKYNIKDKRFVQQKILIAKINEILDYPTVFEEKSFDWLKFEKSLKVDAYYPDFNLIVEYDGEQHFQVVRWNPKQSMEEAKKLLKLQQKRDKTKEKLIRTKDIKLIRFKFDEPLTKKYIRKKLIENEILTP